MHLFNTLFVIGYLTFVNKAYSKSIMMNKIIKEISDPDPDSDSNLLNSTMDTLVDDVAPPRHLDAVKIARDGKLNSNFHKEVFLGEEVENFENGNYELKAQKDKLEEIFHTIDLDRNQYLEVPELSQWVIKKSKEHFDEARIGNDEKFNKLDTNQDGLLFWNEFLAEFLAEKGLNKKEVIHKLTNKIQVEVSEKLKDQIDDLRDKWNEAASESHPNQLNVTQFLDFQHPESSRAMLLYMVDDFLHDLDMDGNGNLTVYEFMAVAPDTNVDSLDDEWPKLRRREFMDVLDENHDGFASREEIAIYLDPQSKTMAEQEAHQLISFGDENDDGKLSLDELLENSEYYTGSKLYNYAKSVHEEF